MSARLRWKLNPAETGLRSVGAAPRGYTYHDGNKTFAWIYPNGGGWTRPQKGWYWVVTSPLPYKNTCDSPAETIEEAKAAAAAYVKQHMRATP